MPRPARLPPVLLALCLQAVAIGASLAGARLLGGGAPLGYALVAGVLAAALGLAAGLERWWLPIQLLFAPALWLMFTLAVSPWVYFAAFAALVLVYWSTFRTRVPLYLSGPRVWEAVCALLPRALPDRRLRVIDLGCGLGGLVAHLAQARADADVEGVELAPLPALVSWSRARLTPRGNARVRRGSYWQLDLGAYDVVFAFLSPVPMPELWRKARREMRGGTLFISSSFAVPGEAAQRVVTVADRRGTRLHVWTM